MDAYTQRLLHNRVTETLEAIDTTVAAADDEVLAVLGATELPMAVAALRALLDGHVLDDDGRCRACRTRVLRRPTPGCTIAATVHHAFTDHQRGRRALTAAATA
ncbi:hypothetical protein GCM10022247_35190 [Allokutzneria multivorans]|uniref:HNH endonuclease n=1 Tax=Allokutzneria multivorans TaxID=1142134 RepID=A0ABP7SCU2_9PSEU